MHETIEPPAVADPRIELLWARARRSFDRQARRREALEALARERDAQVRDLQRRLLPLEGLPVRVGRAVGGPCAVEVRHEAEEEAVVAVTCAGWRAALALFTLSVCPEAGIVLRDEIAGRPTDLDGAVAAAVAAVEAALDC